MSWLSFIIGFAVGLIVAAIALNYNYHMIKKQGK
tara:strand:+ start:1365 stop:1466 length:102 start_codon:yes stop_codon:yes gene_type:complete